MTWPVAGTPVVASAQTGVDNQTDVFAIKDGQLTVSWVQGSGAWTGPVAVGPVREFWDGSPLAVSPRENQTEVVAFGKNSQLQVFWVTGSGKWQGPVGVGPTNKISGGANLATSPQYGTWQTDVFAISNQGQLQVFWVVGENSGQWGGPIGVGPEKLTSGGALAASPQYGVTNQTDVFTIDQNGQLQVFWVVHDGAWAGPIGVGPTGKFTPGAPVAVSPQYGVPNQTDVFAIDKFGQLQVFWVTGNGQWRGPIGLGPTGKFPQVAALAAYGAHNQTEVSAIDQNGQLQVFWVTGNGQWQGPVGKGPVGKFPAGAPVAASPQYGTNQTDVFAIGNDNLLNIFWVTDGVWHGPVERPF